MATTNIFTPKTNVEILPFTLMGCENNTGVIVKSCLTACCTDTANPIGWCETYTVRYLFKSCTNCSYVETDFCKEDLLEIP